MRTVDAAFSEFKDLTLTPADEFSGYDAGACADVDDWVNFLDEALDYSIHETKCGATKAVILAKDCNFVLKIPFTGNFDTFPANDDDVYLDDDGDEVYDANCEFITEFHDFANANLHLNDYENVSAWDYCRREEIVSKIAEDAGFGEFFAKTEFWGMTKGGMPLYIQPKCTPLVDCSDVSISENSRKLIQTDKWLDVSFCEEWTGVLIDKVGEERAYEFLQWINKQIVISDLHYHNIGYNEAGFPILIDFCGFWEA